MSEQVSAIEENTVAESSISPEEGEAIAFPYKAEDGKLVFNSVFPSDIDNPDCNLEYKDGVASIEFKNLSEEYLRSVALTVTMTDGSVRTFWAADVPSEATCWAFEKDNQSVEMEQAVQDISYDSSFGAYENSVMDFLTVDVDGTSISITNNSDQEMGNLQVICHDDMGDAFFGGTSYRYTVDYVGAGETAVVEAAECLLGVRVVDITKE